MQFKSIKAALNGDTLVILPTGYGKTLIMDIIMNMGETDKKAVIISPLNAIIHEQCQRLGDQALHLTQTMSEMLKKCV